MQALERIDVTPRPQDPYVWVDVQSNSVPSNAVGVVLEFFCSQGFPFASRIGARKNGSTDGIVGFIHGKEHVWICTGVDGNGVFEVYLASWKDYEEPLYVYIVGYIEEDEGVFFTNMIDKTPVALDTWEDIDISGNTGDDTALLAFFQLVKTTETGDAVNKCFGLRENGSTDELDGRIENITLRGAFISVDDNEVLEGLKRWVDIVFYLNGYLFAKFDGPGPNAKNYSAGVADIWVDTDISADVPPGNSGAFCYSPTVYMKFGIRPKGSVYENFELSQAIYPWVGIDSNSVFQQKTASISKELYLLGYSVIPGEPGVPSDLLCEQIKNPTDVADPNPEFSAIYHGG